MQWAPDETSNPFLDLGPNMAARDPALLLHEGVMHCFYTTVGESRRKQWHTVDVIRTTDLRRWTEPERVTPWGVDFVSPGNLLRVADKWVMCCSSYPTAPGERAGSEEARLFLLESPDLASWSEPRMIQPQGCTANWTDSPRQIDAYLVAHQEDFWCLYKTSGCLGLLVSRDLERWSEASPDRPILGPRDTPDGATVENPCVVRDGDEFVMFVAPCRKGRGIGVCRSGDLLRWHDVRYLDLPELPWAPGGPTAAMVLDLREECGRWLMAFHGDRSTGVGEEGALALAWSEDLETWRCD